MTGTEIILSPAPALQPARLFKAARRVLEFFTAQVNDHTRKAYLNARFAEWCDEQTADRPKNRDECERAQPG